MAIVDSLCSAKIHAQSWNFRTAVTSFSGCSLSTSLLIELPCPFGMKIFRKLVNNTKVHTQTSHLRESTAMTYLSQSHEICFVLES